MVFNLFFFFGTAYGVDEWQWRVVGDGEMK